MRETHSFGQGLPADLVPLVAAARLNPDDDLARLVLADWLEELGPPEERARGAFIRLQLQAGRLPTPGGERTDVQRRAAELRRRHGRVWLGTVGRVPGVARYEFVRGFARLHLTGGLPRVGGLDHLAGQPAWHWVDGLRTDAWQDAESAARQSSSAAWAGLTNLHFRSGHWRACLEALLATRMPEYWHTLELSYWPVDADLARKLAGCPALGRLGTLNLPSVGLGDAGAVALADSPGLPSLTVLHLVGNDITDRGARALLDSPHRAGLRRLELGWGNRLSPAILEEARARYHGGAARPGA